MIIISGLRALPRTPGNSNSFLAMIHCANHINRFLGIQKTESHEAAELEAVVELRK